MGAEIKSSVANPSISGWTLVYVEGRKPVLLFDHQPKLGELAKAMKEAYKLPTVPNYYSWPDECFLTEFTMYEPSALPLRFFCVPYTPAEAHHEHVMGFDIRNMSDKTPRASELAEACWLTKHLIDGK